MSRHATESRESQTYRARRLKLGDLALAYAVVRARYPSISLERWMDYARPLVELAPPVPPRDDLPPRGVVGLENRLGYLQGVFSYTRRPDLRHGRLLRIRDFVALDLCGRAGATQCLIAEIEALTRALDCPAVEIDLPRNWAMRPQADGSVFSKFRQDGHEIDAVLLSKVVADP